MKTFTAIFALVLLLGGCDSDQAGGAPKLKGYETKVETPIKFRLPAGPNSIQITQEPGLDNYVFKQSPYSHPNKWVIYMASAPWVKDGTVPFTGRAVMDIFTNITLMDFLENHSLRGQVDVVWLQYDDLPLSRAQSWGGMGAAQKMPGNLSFQNTHHIFDAYVISPAARTPRKDALLYSEWIRPFIFYRDDVNKASFQHSDKRSGIDDNNSSFWDSWGRHFFIVDPDGMVRDAYVSIGNGGDQSWPFQAMQSIVHHLNVDPGTVVYPEHHRKAQYRAFYSPNIEGEFHNSMNLIDKGMRQGD